MTNLGSAEIAKNGSAETTKQPRLSNRLLLGRFVQGLNSSYLAGLPRDSFQLLAAEAFAPQLKDRCVVKDPVQRTEQGGILIEILSPEPLRLQISRKIEENYKKYFPMQLDCTDTP